MFDIEGSRELLEKAEVFFDFNPEHDMDPQTLNMNDVWGWACADGEHVPDEDLPRVAELFRRYGKCGILYWVSERNGRYRSEFHDINRFIDFVREEEAIRTEIPDDSQRAYAKRQYMVGSDNERCRI